jgi:hypothetical protein
VEWAGDRRAAAQDFTVGFPGVMMCVPRKKSSGFVLRGFSHVSTAKRNQPS